MGDKPSINDIRRVMAQCPGCSKDMASTCLQLCGNDVDKAVEKYKRVEKFLPEEVPSNDDNEDNGSNDDNEDNNDDDDRVSQATDTSPDETEMRATSQTDSDEEGPSWILKLPKLPVSHDFINDGPPDPSNFELHKLLAAIQAGHFDADRVRTYLHYFNKETLTTNLNTEVRGFPAMFYIVSTNDVGIIRQWIKYGGNPNATWGPEAFPLVAFSIFHGAKTMKKASSTLATLLRFDANPRLIPKAFYDPYCVDLPEGGPAEEILHDINDGNKRWCTEEVRAYLAKALNLSQRYSLYRSSKLSPPTKRQKTVLDRQEADEVLGLHQMIVGQSIATRWLQRKLLIYLAQQKRRPFILVFAGPSGHGKTELARRFGELMSLELERVDCTIFKQDNELFGPRPPYSGHEDGSLLNNFLARKSGERCIVFMDEFEKTSEEIHNTLLLPFQEGRYEDRRKGTLVDCSRTIWILATNKLDDSIHAFCKANEQVLFYSEDEDVQDRLVGELCSQLRKEVIGQFGAPLAGRITEILPFLTFSPREAAVIVHKGLMDMEAEVDRKVRLTLNKEEDIYVGNINIRVNKDATVCSTIAQEEYDRKTGARSINQGLERVVEDPLIDKYLKIDEELDENQPVARFVVDVNVDKDVEVRLVR
ncbi:P-loop containing nucleoside triphosphate hydrolase protein [Hypoxylon trugodes]|uniref:P-loop containing nucleoside triphosphate hydrolase protein n=1 Tax=Hypoxylon trugodes TaxID=326681 RepID=UPI002197D5D9|nr:P-loop containing nucleoside triphosphate hydrolase protein [Hypoxylon trugodes]KAI1387329.1 P-loop containing nucleoside triphosphate hydrolase protein [Hypoxylon trugodes]